MDIDGMWCDEGSTGSVLTGAVDTDQASGPVDRSGVLLAWHCARVLDWSTMNPFTFWRKMCVLVGYWMGVKR